MKSNGSCSRRFGFLFWSIWARDVNVMHTLTCRPNTCIHQINVLKSLPFLANCSVQFVLLLPFAENSEAIFGVPTSYAALPRIKKSSASSAFGSKVRPRYSSPSLGTQSVSPPSWRGAAQQYHPPVNLYHSSDAFRQDGKCRKSSK